ncbi:hypothetical protein BG004_005066 [Podila humilis]|nr:hypothetical protein BG004_005066 [Podila humilis]
MDSHANNLKKHLEDSQTSDRPEVRAKASIGLVTFASEHSPAGVDWDRSISTPWQDAWIGILRGLGDEWPLVREAFQEQLVKSCNQPSNSLVAMFDREEFYGQVMEIVREGKNDSPVRSRQIASGLLTLQQIIREYNFRGDNIHWFLRICKLVSEEFTATQAIAALGSMTGLQDIRQNIEEFAIFCHDMLDALLAYGQKESNPTSSSDMPPPLQPTKDWALAFWISEQLRIPTVFVDNTYTLHRLIISAASFTNPKDLWNTLDLSLGRKIVQQAHETLKVIAEYTPWSDRSGMALSHSSTPTTTTATITHRKQCQQTHQSIMIPGNLSDHVIKILQNEMRQYFVHARAQSIENRAQATVASHQDRTRQRLEQEKKELETIEDSDSASGLVLETDPKHIVPRQQQALSQHSSSSFNRGGGQRFQIAKATDLSNEMEALHDELLQESQSTTTMMKGVDSMIKKWDRDCLEAVAVTEWCAQQPVQDKSQIQQVFMILIGPILALLDSSAYRFKTRGLNLLCRFLLQHQIYHGIGGGSDKKNKGVNSTTTQWIAFESHIWIKIFEKTGLDQVLVEAIVPLIAPLEANVAANEIVSPDPEEALYDDRQHDHEMISAAFRTFLALVLVNTEPKDLPSTVVLDDSEMIAQQRPPPRFHAAHDEGTVVGGTPTNPISLTVEELFIMGALGSFRRVNPSKAYRALIMTWIKILIQPVISFEFLVEELETEYFTLLKSDSGQGHPRWRGVFGLGSLAIKYLPTLVGYLCEILDMPLPSTPPHERCASLEMARRAAEALYELIQVARPRIPRYRGRVLAALANCWANSRVFESTNPSGIASTKPAVKQNLTKEQQLLDTALVRAMKLCVETCRRSRSRRRRPSTLGSNSQAQHGKISEIVKEDIELDKKDDVDSGLDHDLLVLKELDPTVFAPLFFQ